MAYHFDEGVIQARLCGQIKTISAMEALLGDYEQQDYYRRSRRQYERMTFHREEQNRDQHQRTNYANRNDHDQRNNNHNLNTYHNRNYCLLYTSRCV